MNRDNVVIHINLPRELLNELEREYNKYSWFKGRKSFIPAASVKLAAIVLGEYKRFSL